MSAARAGRARNRRAALERFGFGLLRFGFVAGMLLFLLVPFYWVAVTSIKPPSDYLANPPVWFPAEPTLLHYTSALFGYRGLQGLINSAIVSVAATILSAALGTMMGHSLARFSLGGQHLAFWVLSQRFLPPIAIVLPLFLLYRGWGLSDTRLGLTLLYTVATLPLSVWMMFTYFKQVPREMEEAALVDGCSRWRALWSVALPMAAPGVAAAAVFTFIFCWTEFFFAINLTSRTAFTLPTIFRAFLGFQGAQYGEASALAVVSLIPSIILGIAVQKYLVQGRLVGALH